MSNLATAIGSASAVGVLLGGIGGAFLQGIKWRKDRKVEKESADEAPVRKVNLIVDGAEAVVAVLRQDYERVHAENQALLLRIATLEEQAREKDRAIEQLRTKVHAMERELQLLSVELARLQTPH